MRTISLTKTEKKIVIILRFYGLNSYKYPNEIERISAMRDVIKDLRTTGCTNLLISEFKGTGWEREHQFEEYLTQGVILLRTFLKDTRLVRVFQVEKMRGLAIDKMSEKSEKEIMIKGIVLFFVILGFCYFLLLILPILLTNIIILIVLIDIIAFLLGILRDYGLFKLWYWIEKRKDKGGD